MLAAALASLLLLGQAVAQQPTPPAPITDLSYEIGAEDVLEITVWKEEHLKKEVLVRPDGGISFPLVGDVTAAGKTVGDLRDELAQRLAKFIPDPTVSVAVLRAASQRVYVIGKVNKPGEFPMGRPMNVLQALSMAGGLTPFAARDDIKIMRKQGSATTVLPFEYSRIERGEKLEQNITLRSGDVVVVP
jgi:polysaccharide export outer membrane protein